MTSQDMVIEYFLDHGIARVYKGFGYAVELAGWFLCSDGETLFSGMVRETAQKHGISKEEMVTEIRRFSKYIQKKEPQLYGELVGARFLLRNFIYALGENAFEYYRKKHTLLKEGKRR